MCLWVRLNRDANCLPLRAKTVWNPLRMNTERCRWGEGHNSYPFFECRLSAGRLFRQKTRKYCQLEAQASWCCHFQSTCSRNQSAPSQNMFSSYPYIKYLYLQLPFLKMTAFRIILVSLSFNFWWGMVVRLYDRPCLNIHRGDRILIPVPSDC